MSLVSAQNRMLYEMDFLGMDWVALQRFLDRSPSAFSPKTLEAYQVIKEQMHD